MVSSKTYLKILNAAFFGLSLGMFITGISARISVDVNYSLNECPGYDTKQYDAKVPVILELWGMLSIPSLPSHNEMVTSITL